MNQDKIREFVAEYKHKEKLLAKSMELLGRITDATQEQDMHEHWDFEIGIPIDVKAMKKSSRMEDKPNDCYHWIEIMNVNGEKGWLYGKAMYIAFETERFWIFVHRQTLVDFIQEICKDKIPTTDPFETYKIYSREGRSDKLTQAKTIDLMSISDFLIMKEDNSLKTIRNGNK